MNPSNGGRQISVTRRPDLSRFRGLPPGRILVASDFDGTLAPIVHDPAAARLLPAAAEALARLVPLVLKVAVVSGRGLPALRRLVDVEGVLLLGDYGLGEPEAGEKVALDRFNERVGGLLGARAGVSLEVKPGSSSVHFRGAPELASELAALVEPAAATEGLQVRPGRLVLEIMPWRAEKGAAIQRLVSELGPAGVVFAGDDMGDRRAFEVTAALPVPHLALGVRSAEAPADLFTACDAVVDGPDEVAEFLSRLAEWCQEEADGPGRAGREAGG